ncbi:MAG: hypothetical protein HRU38_15470 [Saccharospirillaceae bacterium]|nr:hypothetical protein [Pseudomonadales bacterium]NRB80040.1 hypothetical protein [Saccharospirillaceae bacterium]
MSKIILLTLTSLILVACGDKFEVPEFSAATLEITTTNFDDVLAAKDKNYAAASFSTYWWLDYVDSTSNFLSSHTAYCDNGNIEGAITDEKETSSKYTIEATLSFNQCLVENETITGKVNFDISGNDTRITNLTDGSYTIVDSTTTTTFSSHYFRSYISDSEIEFKEYAQIKIYSPLITEGIVNFYTETPFKINQRSIEGEEIIEGANNTSIKIIYTTNTIDYYLNGELFDSSSY